MRVQPGEYEEGSPCLCRFTDTITREMDLAIDPKTGNRRDRATIRELLQMRAYDKTPDTDTSTRLIREGLIEKLWLEKQGGVVS